jgi:trigger factor
MKYKAKSIEECTTLFEIEVSPQMIARALDEVYADIAKVANVPGFRVGKAPADMVRLRYAKDAREEVLKRLLPEAYRQAVKQQNIDPVGLPEISDVSFPEDKPLTFKAKVETRPKFKLKDYKGIKVEKKKADVKDADVDKTIENLREVSAKYISVEARPVMMNDYVVTDLECFVDGKSIHKKRENLWLAVDKDSYIGGMAEQMAGMNKLEERDIEVKLPENYPDKAVAGRQARYHVLVKEIKERRLPSVDDEFAKDIGRPSLEDLRKEIAKELAARAAANSETEAENSLLNALIDGHVFKVPSGFVARQIASMVADSKKRLEEKGFKREDLDKRDKEFAEKFRQDAERQVRLLFILDSIASAERIEATDADVGDAYRAIAAQAGKDEAFVRGHYEKEGLVDSLREKIRESKTIRFLMDHAAVTEKEGI